MSDDNDNDDNEKDPLDDALGINGTPLVSFSNTIESIVGMARNDYQRRLYVCKS
jgi:hypothetical protein